MEIASGPFERGISLPAAIDPEQTKASYQNGIVEVVLPKVKEEWTQRVKIKAA
jgi:HSP20 family protein